MSPPADKPRLLLHACCAPCSTVPLERLRGRYQVSLFFFGPNIHPRAEYLARLEEVRRFCLAANVPLIEGPYRPADWGRAVLPFRALPEGSERCAACFRLRLQATAREAKVRGLDAFSATLSIGRQKKSAQVAQAGRAASQAEGIAFHEEDFKKGGGFDRSVVLSKGLGLRRQEYCGCALSRERQRSPRGARP
jgi:predicted adenine nucleotide alpha hydrolase (AANH) superfamily ATPase